MSLNELIRFAKMHDIDFDKDIICVSQFDGEIDLDNLEQIAMKETDEGNKLVIIPFVYSYNANMNEELEFCDTVNSVDLSEKTNVEEELEKENRLLEERNSHLYNDLTCTSAELAEKSKILEQLKELIREFMKYEINEYDGSLEIHFEELKEQAEQFLKE